MHIDAYVQGSTDYFVHGATASVCAAVFDPAVPFIMIEQHRPPLAGGGAWSETTVPLSTGSAADLVKRRVRLLSYDVLMRTDEFFAALPGLEPCELIVSQWSAAPSDLTRIGEHMLQPHLSALMAGKGAALAFFLPHRNETSRVFGPDATTVARSHARVTSWLDAAASG